MKNKEKHRSFEDIAIVLFAEVCAWAYKTALPPPPRKLGSLTSPRIKLHDGRHLSYKEYGVPKDVAKSKIIYVHCFDCSKYQDPFAFSASPAVIEQLGVHIVALDRPGYGESDPDPKRTVKSLALDIEELADELNLGQKFYVAGFSMGGEVIWSCLKYIPHRLAGAVLISPAVNYWWHNLPSNLTNEAYSRQLQQDQWSLRVAHYLPWLTYWWNTQSWFPASRVTSRRGLRFYVDNGGKCDDTLTRNVVYKEVTVVIQVCAWAYKTALPPPPRKLGSLTSPRIKLHDGRHLSYKEYGVPKDVAKSKIIYVHCFDCSKYQDPFAFSASPAVIEQLGVHIVALDRPGYGESDPDPKRTVKSLALDIEELADELNLGQKFYVAGFSMGGEVIWSCLKYIPHRLAGAVLISPAVNYWWHNLPSNLTNEAYSRQLQQDQWSLRVAHYLPWLTYWWNTQSWFPASRVTSRQGLRFYVDNGGKCDDTLTRNVVYKEVTVVIQVCAWAYKTALPPPPRKLGSLTSPRIKLHDGRHLSYKEYGVPKDVAKSKIIYVHCFDCSKYQDPFAFSASPAVIEQLGVHIVALDRPGYGESDPDPKRTVKSLALDIEELADELNLGQKFYVAGFSMGGEVIWSCLKYIPHRLAGAVLISPAVNYWWHNLPSNLTNEAYSRQLQQDQWSLRVAHYLPWLTYWWNTQSWFPASRVTSRQGLRFYVDNGGKCDDTLTRNVVYKEVTVVIQDMQSTRKG
ncbi:hypothetical protein L1987_67901 [Smallanthus sonchifolius]|uniref:Uncharacterized protein n=1 Tax=Smallanthus sonchifolius TaxID=185202 RepID=A0ACB9B4M9_9ASTR|nr:hypothetical protein L1987_67901 [Smallanthus sonchifolius]